MTSYISLLSKIEAFCNAHLQIKKYGGEFREQMPNFATKDEKYPVVFVTPTSDTESLNTNQFTVDVYCVDIIQADRANLNSIISDCQLILKDMYVYYTNDNDIEIDVIGTASMTPLNNQDLDYVAGWVMSITFEVASYGDCAIPMLPIEPNPSPGCEDAIQIITDLNNKQLYVNSIPSGATETQVIANSTAILQDTSGTFISSTSIIAEGSENIKAPNALLHIKKENDGTITNLTLLSNSSTQYIVDNNDISVNGVLEFDIHATEALDIRLRDTSNAVITPISVTDMGNHAMIVLPTAPIDADAQAFLTATGITDATTTYAITFLVDNLKSKGIWNKCYGLYPLVGGTATTQKFNLKNPLNTDAAFRLEFFGGITHDVNGIQGNGVNGYLDFKIIPASHLIVNNTHACYYCTTNINEAKLDLSSQQGGDFGLYNYSSTYYTDQYNQTSGSGRVGIANADTTGFIVGSRVASNNLKLFRNGSQIGTTATGSGGVISGMTSSVFGMAGRASATTAHLFSSRKYAFFSIGEGLTVSEQLAYNNIVQAFQTILSRNV